jgi:hypothetical protein
LHAASRRTSWAIERSLATLTERIAAEDGGADESLLQELTRRAAEVESGLAASQFRFGACRAYHELVTRRIAELHERELPGNQRVAAAGGHEAAELLDQLVRLQGQVHRRPLVKRASMRRSPPRMPSRANSTTRMSSRPSQNCQYCGFKSDRRSCATTKTMVPSKAPYKPPVPPNTRISMT